MLRILSLLVCLAIPIFSYANEFVIGLSYPGVEPTSFPYYAKLVDYNIREFNKRQVLSENVTLRLDVCKDSCTSTGGYSCADKLIKTHGDKLIMVGGLVCALSYQGSGTAFNSFQIPYVSFGAVDRNLDTQSVYAYGHRIMPDISAEVLASLTYIQSIGIRKIAVLASDSDRDQGYVQYFQLYGERFGIEILGVQKVAYRTSGSRNPAVQQVAVLRQLGAKYFVLCALLQSLDDIISGLYANGIMTSQNGGYGVFLHVYARQTVLVSPQMWNMTAGFMGLDYMTNFTTPYAKTKLATYNYYQAISNSTDVSDVPINATSFNTVAAGYIDGSQLMLNVLEIAYLTRSNPSNSSDFSWLSGFNLLRILRTMAEVKDGILGDLKLNGLGSSANANFFIVHHNGTVMGTGGTINPWQVIAGVMGTSIINYRDLTSIISYIGKTRTPPVDYDIPLFKGDIVEQYFDNVIFNILGFAFYALATWALLNIIYNALLEAKRQKDNKSANKKKRKYLWILMGSVISAMGICSLSLLNFSTMNYSKVPDLFLQFHMGWVCFSYISTTVILFLVYSFIVEWMVAKDIEPHRIQYINNDSSAKSRNENSLTSEHATSINANKNSTNANINASVDAGITATNSNNSNEGKRVDSSERRILNNPQSNPSHHLGRKYNKSSDGKDITDDDNNNNNNKENKENNKQQDNEAINNKKLKWYQRFYHDLNTDVKMSVGLLKCILGYVAAYLINFILQQQAQTQNVAGELNIKWYLLSSMILAVHISITLLVYWYAKDAYRYTTTIILFVSLPFPFNFILYSVKVYRYQGLFFSDALIKESSNNAWFLPAGIVGSITVGAFLILFLMVIIWQYIYSQGDVASARRKNNELNLNLTQANHKLHQLKLASDYQVMLQRWTPLESTIAPSLPLRMLRTDQNTIESIVNSLPLLNHYLSIIPQHTALLKAASMVCSGFHDQDLKETLRNYKFVYTIPSVTPLELARIFSNQISKTIYMFNFQNTHSDENVLFCALVFNYQGLNTHHYRYMSANDIVRSFLKENAPNRLNLQRSDIDSIVRKFDRFLEEKKPLPVDLFTPLLKSTCKLLQDNTSSMLQQTVHSRPLHIIMYFCIVAGEMYRKHVADKQQDEKNESEAADIQTLHLDDDVKNNLSGVYVSH